MRVGECGCNMYVHPRHGWLWRRHRVRCSFSNRTCQACMYKIGRLTSCVLQKSVFVLMYSGLSSSRKSLLSFNDYCSLTGKPRDLQYADAVGQCHEIKEYGACIRRRRSRCRSLVDLGQRDVPIAYRSPRRPRHVDSRRNEALVSC